MNNPKQLKARFPYQFAGQNIGLSISRGWFPLFEQLCEDIDRTLGEDKRKFHWTQLKEKFGSARFYFSLGGKSAVFVDMINPDAGEASTFVLPAKVRDEEMAALHRQITSLVDAATAKTHDLCIVCGAPGAQDRHDQYLLVLCQDHARLRRQGKLPSAWFEEDEQ
jgi:hypothetical protein